MSSTKFEEKEIVFPNLAYYEINYISITPIFDIEKTFKILDKRFKQNIQHKLEIIKDPMKVSLSVFHRYSYKDMSDNNKIDVLCITTNPHVVTLKDNIELFVKNLIDEYTYNFEKEIKEQYDKCHINFFNIELLKIKFYEIKSRRL